MGFPAVVTHYSQLKECANYMKRRHSEHIRERQVNAPQIEFVRINELKTISPGADRMDNIRRLVSSVPGYQLSYFQKKALKAMYPRIAMAVFEDSDIREMQEYFRRNRWSFQKQRFFFMQTSRRCGKTQTLTLLAAAVLASIPHMEIVCWSLFNATSALFGSTVYQWLLDMGIPKTRINKNEERIIVHGDGPEDRRFIYLMGSQRPNVSCIYFLFLLLPLYILYIFMRKKNE